MSDNEVQDAPKKRGRKPAAPKAEKPAKKRPAEDSEEDIHEDSPEADAPKSKRGRGRPKGSTGGVAKKPKVPGRGRGRPKKNAS
ncbi:unnamed protein product [Notodromas monacha]|uniref:Uncharacterized protein n=1 Tax=Notodromas monacha TaxID=399045 RepID=A0A7R9BZW3_9CRUS|nr:unnamed protein product [Notodromas monacha]CAG0923404.1 unnamed protein product [Notodromas monacha]